MNKKISKQNIVDTILLNNEKGIDATFKKELEKSLLNKFKQDEFNMKKILTIGLSFLTISAFGLFVYSSFFAIPKENTVEYDKVVSQISKDSNNQGDSAMKIAVEDHESISAATSFLSFTPLKPYALLGGQLSSVQTGKTFDGTKSDSIYLQFAKDNDFLFNLNQVKQNSADFFIPEESKLVSFTVNGQIVKGYYVEYDNNDIDPNSEMALYEGNSAKSVLSFNVNNVSIDISQFGNLTEENLIDIAQSLK